MRNDIQKLGHQVAAKICGILAEMPDSIPVTDFQQTRREYIKETETRVTVNFPNGNKLTLWLDEKDAK